MYFNKRKTQIKLSIQKKRKLPKIYFFKKFSFLKRKKIKFFILSKNYLHIELKFYKVFVKKIRKIAKKKRAKAFLYLCCNDAWFKKSKNSRMGKGKGRYVRYVYRTKICKPVLALSRLSKYRVQKLVKIINNIKNAFFLHKIR